MKIDRKGMNGTSEFIIPGFVGIMIFVIIPLVDVFISSFQKSGTGSFAGLQIMLWLWRMMHSGWRQATLYVLNL